MDYRELQQKGAHSMHSKHQNCEKLSMRLYWKIMQKTRHLKGENSHANNKIITAGISEMLEHHPEWQKVIIN